MASAKTSNYRIMCHDDLTASDLVGRYLITSGETVWVNGTLGSSWCYNITIGKGAGYYLPHMYGAENYVLIEDISKLPLKVSDIYRKSTS